MLAGPRGEVVAVTNTKRGRERGTVVENEDMSIDDMVREERRTRGQAGGEGLRLAERIAKDAKFDNDLEYLDENAAKLAKRVHKNEASLTATRPPNRFVRPRTASISERPRSGLPERAPATTCDGRAP